MCSYCAYAPGCTYVYLLRLRYSAKWVNNMVSRFSADTVYLVTDLDVMPLRPLDALVRWFAQQRTVELAFMREPGRTIGMHGVQWALNTGFFLLRNTWKAAQS